MLTDLYILKCGQTEPKRLRIVQAYRIDRGDGVDVMRVMWSEEGHDADCVVDIKRFKKKATPLSENDVLCAHAGSLGVLNAG